MKGFPIFFVDITEKSAGNFTFMQLYLLIWLIDLYCNNFFILAFNPQHIEMDNALTSMRVYSKVVARMLWHQSS